MTRALLLAVALASAPAAAVFQCGDTQDTCPCGANNPYPCCDNGGNCTWYAWHNACCSLNVGLPGWGNAKQWTGNARANASYAVLSSPVVNSVSCRDIGTYGHVAFVSSLNGGGNITVREQNCFSGYGSRSYNYASSYFTGGFITKAGQTQCSPGDRQERSCGNCGTQSRGCGNTGTWGGWSTCSSEGVCAPGTTEEKSCGDCGTSKRTCTASCQWADYGACAAVPEPPDAGSCVTGKAGACGTGAKVCAASGVFECRETVTPREEVCDGVDNDCDGFVDGPSVCVVALGAPPAVDAPGGPEEVRRMELRSVGCSSSPAWPAVLLVLALGRRRRARGPGSPPEHHPREQRHHRGGHHGQRDHAR